jgi:ribonuclease R
MDELSQRVLALFDEPDAAGITLKVIAKRFQVDDEGYAALRAAVKSLIRMGKLELGKDKGLTKLKPRDGTVVGTFRRSAKGFGFVRPAQGAGPMTGAKTDAIFIPPDASRDASTGDEVLVKITRNAKS